MNAALTGGTGFLGRALLPKLLEAAEQVHVLVRRPENQIELRDCGAIPVLGDLRHSDGCEGLIESGQVIFHAAARVDVGGSWSEFYENTVAGTRNLLDAALPHKPARFVYVSSCAVYSAALAGQGVCADRAIARPAKSNFYARAKLAAEDLVREECGRAGCPWTIVRLAFLHGPHNRALRATFRPLRERGLLRIIGRGDNRIAALYVDDAAGAVLVAGTHPAASGIYDVASDERVTQREFLEAMSAIVGFPGQLPRVPWCVAYAAAGCAEVIAPLLGRPPRVTRDMVVLMAADQVVDSRRIRDELNWQPRIGFREGMARTAAWYQEAGSHDSL